MNTNGDWFVRLWPKQADQQWICIENEIFSCHAVLIHLKIIKNLHMLHKRAHQFSERPCTEMSTDHMEAPTKQSFKP